MATILLSAAGAALGSSLGGSVLGLSATVLGRAAGATLGRVIDARILGAGSPAVETGKIDRPDQPSGPINPQPISGSAVPKAGKKFGGEGGAAPQGA